MKLVVGLDAPVGGIASPERFEAEPSTRVRRCLPPPESVVFDSGSLSPGVPQNRLRVALDTVVGFERLGDEIQMAAAAGLVNGTSIRREVWPCRQAAWAIAAHHPIELDGTHLATVRQSHIARVAVWAGPSILGWDHANTGDHYPMNEEGPNRDFPVGILSDGHWVEIQSFDREGEDFVMRCRLTRRARWVRIISAALLPAGHAVSEAEPRRFGVAIVGLAVGSDEIPLDSAAIISGFYPREGDAPRYWRWTNGSGLVALQPSASEQVMTVRFTTWHEMLAS